MTGRYDRLRLRKAAEKEIAATASSDTMRSRSAGRSAASAARRCAALRTPADAGRLVEEEVAAPADSSDPSLLSIFAPAASRSSAALLLKLDVENCGRGGTVTLLFESRREEGPVEPKRGPLLPNPRVQRQQQTATLETLATEEHASSPLELLLQPAGRRW